MASIKFLWLGSWIVFATLLVVGPILLVSYTGGKGNFAFNMSRIWAWMVIRAAGVRVKLRGNKKIPINQSYMVISNHQSHFDGPALALSLGIQFRWIAKKELLKIPFFGRALYSMRNIFIDRANREMAIQSIQEGVRRIPPGVSVMCFAEGTRSNDGKIKEFKKGGFVAAIENKFPILPVTVNGSARILSKGSLVFYPGLIEIVVGDPIDTHEYPLDRLQDLINKVRDVIISEHHPELVSREIQG